MKFQDEKTSATIQKSNILCRGLLHQEARLHLVTRRLLWSPWVSPHTQALHASGLSIHLPPFCFLQIPGRNLKIRKISIVQVARRVDWLRGSIEVAESRSALHGPRLWLKMSNRPQSACHFQTPHPGCADVRVEQL